MATIQSKLKEQVEELIADSNNEFQQENYIKSIELLEKAWIIVPNPKGIYSESYYLARDIIETCFIIKDFSRAKDWSEKIFLTGFMRIDTGEKEFIAGKVAYELGELDIATEFFLIASKKSEGRCFEDEDSKYIKLIRG